MADIVLTDDHVLLRSGLVALLTNLGHNVLYEADNGVDLMKKLKENPIPQIILLDINMPEMDGYDTALCIRKEYPAIRILALSMYDNEKSIIKMLANGAHGYILKDCEPAQLKDALKDLVEKGFYFSDLVSGKMMNVLSLQQQKHEISQQLTERELAFLKYSCTELTYKEIADKMNLSPRTIDGYRDALFEKLAIKTRIGLVLYAIKKGIVDLD